MNKKLFNKLKLHIVIVLIAVAALIVQFVLLCIGSSAAGKLPSQNSAKRWSADGTNYAQISCFISPNAGYNNYSIMDMHTSMENALTENSIKAANENARLWIYAYSSESNVSIRSNRASMNANVTITGGDFFIIHPLKLIDGSYYSDSLITDEHIVIDENAAWKLFGSTDVAGLEVEINGTAFTVTGVVKPEDNEEYTSPHVYMPMSVYERAGNAPKITCLEFILPNPVSGFALGLVEKTVSVSESNIEITDNSSRFNMMSLYSYIGNFKSVLVGKKLISYPYWENIEKLVEFKCAVILIFRTVCFALIGLCVLIEFIVFYIAKDRIFDAAKRKAIITVDSFEMKYRKNQEAKVQKKKLKAVRTLEKKNNSAKTLENLTETESSVESNTKKSGEFSSGVK